MVGIQLVCPRSSVLWINHSADAKRTPSYSPDLHFLTIIMYLSDLTWQYWSDLPKSEISNIEGVKYFNNNYNLYRFEVCTEIEKIMDIVLHLPPKPPRLDIIVNLYYRAYSIVNLITYFRAFSNIFSNILMPICRAYMIILRNVGPRFKRGCF